MDVDLEPEFNGVHEDALIPTSFSVSLSKVRTALGFPLPRVEAAGGVVRAAVGDEAVVVFATPDGVHAFADPGFEFAPAGDGRFRADGTTWDAATGEAADGRRQERVRVRWPFAFARQDDHGPGSRTMIGHSRT